MYAVTETGVVGLQADCSIFWLQRLQRHVSKVSATGFHQLRRLRRVRRSLDAQQTETLVHFFVTSRVDYTTTQCSPLHQTSTDKLRRVLNAAARVVSNTSTRKFDHGLSRLMHQDVHWLNIPERVSYKLCMLTHRCLLGKVPRYLSEYCVPVAHKHIRPTCICCSRPYGLQRYA